MSLEPAWARALVIDDEQLDGYARRGVALSRDAGSVVLAALRRDTHELRTRGGSANNAAADQQDLLARAILEALR